MKIKSVTVQNFRGYKDAKRVIFDDLTLIVGKNDIGKSTILEAIDIFFGNRKADKNDLNINCDKNTEKISISVEFCDLPEEIDLDQGAKTTLSDEYLLNKNGFLEIKKIINPNSQAQSKNYIIANYPENQENLLILKNNELKKIASELDIDKSTYNASVNNSLRKAIYLSKNSDLRENVLEIDKEDGKEIFAKIEQEMPLYTLFSADRKNSDQDSEIQDPIKSSIKQIIKDLGPELEPIKQQILDRLNDVATGTIEKLREMNKDVANDLKPITDAPTWEKAFSVTMESDGVPLNKRGSGVKRLVLISFFRNEAERIKKEKQKSSIIYAIEEPETSQHPDWQIKLFEAFNELTDSGNIQIILTSHHPELTGLVSLENIRLIKKVDNNIQIETGSGTNYKEIAKTLGVLPRIDGVKVVVCLEGPNDVRFMKNISSMFNVDKNDERILWIPVGGSTLRDYVNEKYLEKLQISQIHFYDRDSSGVYQNSIDKVNAEGNFGKLTNLLTLENYFHPSLYKIIWNNLQGDFVDLSNDSWKIGWGDKNIPNELSLFIRTEHDSGNNELKNFCSESVKKCIAKNSHHMTNELFIELGVLDELSAFFEAIKSKLI